MNSPEQPEEKRDISMNDHGTYREINLRDDSRYVEGNYTENNYYCDVDKSSQQKPRDQTQQILLKAVKKEIESRLHHSLHNRIPILLDKKGDYSLVEPRIGIDVKIGINDSFELSPNTKTIDVYRRSEINGKLLILGEPGSGKTTTILQLGQELIKEAEQDTSQPIPIFFNLSSWKDDQQDIKDWIINSAKMESYGISKKTAKQLLDKNALILFLDGLDELSSARQGLSVQKINKFLETWHGEMVVCGRTKEHQLISETANVKLNLNGSIILQLLDRQKIKDYILRSKGVKLWHTIKDDDNLMDLAKTPLLLNIIVIAREEISLTQWNQITNPEVRLDYLLEAYLRRMFKRKCNCNKQPSQIQTKHYLGWLATQLTKQKETEFFIEYIQPNWLEKRSHNFIFGLVIGLIYGLIHALFFGLMRGIVVMLIGGGLIGVLFTDTNRIETIENLKFSFVRFKKQFIYGLILLLSGVIISGLIYGVFVTSINGIMIYGLIAGLMGGIILGIIRGFNDAKITKKNLSNQGIKESIKNGIILFGLINILGLLLFVSIYIILNKYNLWNWEEISDILIATISVFVWWSLIVFFLPVTSHFSLRLTLYWFGYAPWNYARFLDYATDRLFLQRVGGGYRFLHRLLQDYFVKIYKKEQEAKSN